MTSSIFATLAEEDAGCGHFFSCAGSMFDVKGCNNVDILLIGFTTRLTNATLGILLYVREGGYAGHEDNVDRRWWTLRANVTVEGRGKDDRRR